MKPLKLTSLLSLIILSIACKKPSQVISANVDITVNTSAGINALSSPAIYDSSNISVYYVINGQPQLSTHTEYGRKPFDLIKDGSGDRIRVYLNYTINEPTALTLIKFGNSKIDTIKSDFKFEDNSVFLDKVWFNGVEKAKNFMIIK